MDLNVDDWHGISSCSFDLFTIYQRPRLGGMLNYYHRAAA